MTLSEFEPMYADACVAYHRTPDLNEQRVFFRFVREFPTYAVQAALRELATRSRFWPTVAEVTAEARVQARTFAQQQVEARVKALERNQGDEGPLIHCLDCEDTGWRYVDGRNPEYRYVEPCPCRPSNPVYQKRHGGGNDERGADPPPHEAKRTWERIQRGPEAA